jgi:hypothetical protein
VIRLVHIADLVVTVAEPIEVGHTGGGVRRLIPITGGVANGPEIRGAVLPAGADYQIIRDDGVTELHARYAIRTDDGALIYIENSGLRRGYPGDPALVYFRTAPRFETAAEPYRWLTAHLFIAEGVRRPDRVELAIHRVD